MEMNRREFLKAGTAVTLASLLPPLSFALAEGTEPTQENQTMSPKIHSNNASCGVKADRLILGHIVTLDARYPILEALTVKDGLVQYVGTEEMARKLCDEHTIVMDYGENYIYPGVVESHCHGALAGPRLAYFADLTPGNTMQEYVDIVKRFIDANPDFDAYYGAGWGEKDGQPTAAMLDAICPDKPIALNSFDGHSYWFNTKGMEKFGINADAVKEWGTDIIRVNADGTPTGYISEGPSTNITNQINTLDKAKAKVAYLKWQEFAFSLGMTACYEAGVAEPFLEAIAELIQEGKWKLRVYAGWYIDERAEDYIAEVHKAKEMADKYNCEYLQIIGVKIFMDGVVEAHTAWMIDDYTDRAGYTGVERFNDYDRTVALYEECAKLGLNVHQHTVGDGAVQFALDCMEKAQIETGNMHMRNALAHLQCVSDEDIKRLAALNAVAVVAPLWMSRHPENFYKQSVEYIGDKRTFYGYPLNSFLRHCGILAFHSDFPVSSSISFPDTIYMACRRTNPKNDVYYQWNPDECITREDAIAGLTTGPAYSVGQENHLGCLRIGYAANMSIYDKNFLTDDLEEISEAKTVATIIDGEEVYQG